MTKENELNPILTKPENYKVLNSTSIPNGCGTKEIDHLIPDNLLGLDITEACNIHDFMYEKGGTERERLSADKVFLRNMNAIINYSKGTFLLNLLRKAKAQLYYLAVRSFGGHAFKLSSLTTN